MCICLPAPFASFCAGLLSDDTENPPNPEPAPKVLDDPKTGLLSVLDDVSCMFYV